jgi:hypothetical protein
MKYLQQTRKGRKKGKKKPGVKNILLRIKKWFDEL